MFSKFLQEVVCLRQVLTIGTFTLEQIRYSIKPEPINAHLTPVIQNFKYFLLYEWVIIIEIRLVIEETMPVELLCYRVPRPVRGFKILEDNAHIFILFG